MRKSESLIFIIILLSFTIAFYLYPYFPERMASHWNIKGEVDSYMSKFWGLFLMPLYLAWLLAAFCFNSENRPLEREY